MNHYANYGIGIATNSGRATATVSSSAIGGACALTRACFPARYLLGDDIAQTPAQAQAPPRAAPQAPASAQARGRARVPIPAIGDLQEAIERVACIGNNGALEEAQIALIQAQTSTAQAQEDKFPQDARLAEIMSRS